MSQNPIIAVGKAPDGRLIVDGVWKAYETYGLPLDTIFDVCIRKRWIPDWLMLYIQMTSSGMKHDGILSKLEEAVNYPFLKEGASGVNDPLY